MGRKPSRLRKRRRAQYETRAVGKPVVLLETVSPRRTSAGVVENHTGEADSSTEGPTDQVFGVRTYSHTPRPTTTVRKKAEPAMEVIPAAEKGVTIKVMKMT